MATPLTPLNPHGTVLGDEVYTTLGEAILDGTLAPGERLRDHDLAERLGISRTPVREALQRLERIGLVEVSPNRYTRVSLPNDKLISDTDEFVAYLMGDCLHMALRRCDDETLAILVERADAIVLASRSDERVVLMEATINFFAVVSQATRNVAILTILREAEMAIRRNLSQWHPFIACPIDRSDRYERLRDAVAARDGDSAQALVRELHGFA
ncbi:GntR family transcriptional regulator [Microbacterium lacus]|uniref:GntR family transcriptional regulator n=1 Tax=Microbacterium lacus TaxID=415217 RepID=UPI00384E0AA7